MKYHSYLGKNRSSRKEELVILRRKKHVPGEMHSGYANNNLSRHTPVSGNTLNSLFSSVLGPRLPPGGRAEVRFKGLIYRPEPNPATKSVLEFAL